MLPNKQTKRNLVVVLMALAVVAGPGGVCVTDSYGDEIRATAVAVTTSDAYDSTPTLGADSTGEMVVFTSRPALPEGGFGWGEILCQRLNADGTTDGLMITVSDGTTDDKLNDVSGSRIVYTAFESKDSQLGRVMVYDLETGQHTAIISEAETVYEARIAGDAVVWTQGQGGALKVMYYDLSWSSSLPVIIAGSAAPASNVDIGDSYVVWEEDIDYQGDIVAYDLFTGLLISVSSVADLDERQPATAGDFVVWESTAMDGSMTIELADLSQTPPFRTTVASGSGGGGAYAPSIDGDLVAYESNPAGDLDIYLYRISDAETFQVTNDPAHQWLNNLYGDKVAYVDSSFYGLDVWVSTFELVPVIYVDAGAGGANNGSSWANAYNDLQDALTAAAGGDKIWVAAGTYKPDQGGGKTPGDRTEAFQLINGVALYGGFPVGGGVWAERDPNAYETILSGDLDDDDVNVGNLLDLLDEPTRAENSYNVVEGSGTEPNAVLDGFTITAGNANVPVSPGDLPSPDSLGGGMYNEYGSPTVTNCTFSGNSAERYGGGMRNDNSSPTITNCTFSGNSALDGGGMHNYYLSNPTITNCTFSGNSAERYGGGMSNWYSSPSVTNCTFSGNLADDGGGMDNFSSSSPTVISCTFSGNSADDGGGMYNWGNCSPTLTNCTFSDNTAGNGGGMYNYSNSSPTVTNCTFAGNSASNGNTMACDSYLQQSPSTMQMYNCIFWDGADEIWNNDGSTITINYSDVQGGWTGPGGNNISADPLFADADLRLSEDSLCIDAGDNTAVPSGVTTDLDGNPRFMDDPGTVDTGNGTAPIVDMGAYEFPNTSTGTDVIVHLGELGRPVIVAFAEITAPGVTSATTSSSGPEPPAGSMGGDPETYYDITTTATYDGDIGVSIDYSGTSFVGSEEDLRLYHYEGGAWVDATVLPVDTVNNIIRGTVSSLSLFAIFGPENQPPEVGAISAPLDPIQVSTEVTASAGFSDPDIGDTHTATWDWGDGSTSPGTVGTGTVSGTYTYIIPGVYTVTLTLTDAAGASDQAVFQYVVVFDPGAGFVTGGGWIYSPTGALLDSAAEGKASFGFVAKYKKGATVPTGNTEFRFRAGNFRFKSSSYEWLVVAGKKAMFKGEGSIDSMDGSFKFMLTAVDDTEDKFRIKISDPASEDPIYDNKRGEGDDAESTTIGGGSIVIHGG